MAKTDDPRIELSKYKSITTVALGLLFIVGMVATGSAVAAEESAEGQTAGEEMTVEVSPEEPVTGEEVSLEIDPGESDSEGDYHLYYNGSWHAGLNHTHRYSEPGDYYVLAVKLTNGGEETYSLERITVRESEPSNQEPTVAFDHTPETPVVGENVEFNASASTDSDGSIESYEWDVDGDGDIEASGTTINYSYDSADTYEATLTVTDDDGATDTANATVTVESVEASLEPNDDIESATDVGTGASYTNLETNFTDQDLFAVDVEEGETISVDINVTNGDRAIQARLMENNRVETVAVESVTDRKSINHTAAEDQTYYLELFGTPVETTTYDLEINTTG